CIFYKQPSGPSFGKASSGGSHTPREDEHGLPLYGRPAKPGPFPPRLPTGPSCPPEKGRTRGGADYLKKKKKKKEKKKKCLLKNKKLKNIKQTKRPLRERTKTIHYFIPFNDSVQIIGC
ncbi:hypothetical protein BLX87_16375, partial [Bacillus sp. VT-16-64]